MLLLTLAAWKNDGSTILRIVRLRSQSLELFSSLLLCSALMLVMIDGGRVESSG